MQTSGGRLALNRFGLTEVCAHVNPDAPNSPCLMRPPHAPTSRAHFTRLLLPDILKRLDTISGHTQDKSSPDHTTNSLADFSAFTH